MAKQLSHYREISSHLHDILLFLRKYNDRVYQYYGFVTNSLQNF